MILSDLSIKLAIGAGAIEIDPFNPDQINPASYDLTLGDSVTYYKCFLEGDTSHVLDSKYRQETETFRINKDRGIVLMPKMGYLMHTRERVWTNTYVPVVDGKSSLGRLFVQIHSTAGFGDPGYNGQYTLEMIVQHPVRLYPGMRIAQIRFHTIVGEVENTYDKTGHYTDGYALGAVGSQAYKQFNK